MTAPIHDTPAIRDALALIVPPGQIVELRVLGAGGRSNNTASGYFDDLGLAAQAVARYNGRAAVYCTLHTVNPALFARAGNRMQEYARATTSDADIIARRWVLFDVDSTRPSGISATDEEHELALALAGEIRIYLRARGWPEPIEADSGNGGHLLYPVDLPADDGGLTQRVLAGIAMLFDNRLVKVDRSVHNPARISKVYGTFACKGDDTPDRPHRLARIIDAPEVLRAVPMELLEELAMPAPATEAVPVGGPPRAGTRTARAFDVEGYLRQHGIGFSGPVPYQGGEKWLLDACIWNGHTDKSAIVIRRADGVLCANCNHNSCEGLRWPDLREALEPGYKAAKEARERDYQARQQDAAPPDPIRIGHDHGSTPPAEVERATGEIVPRFKTTDYGNGELLAYQHGRDLHYCHPYGKWLVWDEQRWLIDDTAEVVRRAKVSVRSLYQAAASAESDSESKELAKHAIKSEAEARIRAMIALAQSEPSIPILPDQLDADPWLFSVANGTINLRSGDLQPHNRAHLITKASPVIYDPMATCPTFDAFLARILPEEPLRKFVQKGFGHSMTGDTREDVLFINYGNGSNGKTTLMQTMQAVFGDYALQTPAETLMVKRNEGIPNDVARLKGARLVAASEAEEGKRLAESLIKALTGGDKISARFMRAEWFDFEPDFKIWLSTNHKPVIRGTDNGIWRRIRLIPFEVTIPDLERDETLPEKLRTELPGILNWALAGCRDWLADGLGMPEAVKKATRSYRDEMDILARFIEDSCIQHKNAFIPAADIYAAYRKWADENGEHYETQTGFGKRLRERGFTDGRMSGKRGWFGITFASQEVQDEF